MTTLVPRIGVGGPLHGRLVEVEAGVTFVLAYEQEAAVQGVVLAEQRKGHDVLSDLMLNGLRGSVTIYRVMSRGDVALLVEHGLYESARREPGPGRKGLDETIVGALGTAAGVCAPQPVLTPRT